MKMDEVASSGNDEFYTPNYAITPLLKYIPIRSKVWCPFDTEESIIVKCLCAQGHEVVFTHIAFGQDFFVTPPQGDVIISNPPYSKKTEVLSRLFELKRPFAMLVGVAGLFESKKRFNMFKENKFEIMWLNKRVSYMKSYSDMKPSLNPPFSSVWLTSGLLPEGNVFEEILK